MTHLGRPALDQLRSGYSHFIASTIDGPAGFRLTPRAESTPYARCFAVFGMQLLQERSTLEANADVWAAAIRADLDALRAQRLAAGAVLSEDKPYLQLLTLSLSALSVLDRLDADPLETHVRPVLALDVDAKLSAAGALQGMPQSGNQAMFMAILLLHARRWLGMDVARQIEWWEAAHLAAMNQFGFWGTATSMSHLQFQNGYHQYEILAYLGRKVQRWDAAADHVASLADADGHFAPYPGGGGCYDYDAVFMITGAGEEAVVRHRELLLRTARSIIREQNPDGGFGESHFVRPRSPRNLRRLVAHALSGRGAARKERLRWALTLLRSRHDRIGTHWSRYSRGWAESDLWDSWFRTLTIARIASALDPAQASSWGFIDYPGIGHHSSLESPTGTVRGHIS
jgi:hypothetical protein